MPRAAATGLPASSTTPRAPASGSASSRRARSASNARAASCSGEPAGRVLPREAARGEFERGAELAHGAERPVVVIPQAVFAQQRQVVGQAGGEAAHRVRRRAGTPGGCPGGAAPASAVPRWSARRGDAVRMNSAYSGSRPSSSATAAAPTSATRAPRQSAIASRSEVSSSQIEQVRDVVAVRLEVAGVVEVGDAARVEVDLVEHDGRLRVVAAIVGAGGVGQPERVGLDAQRTARRPGARSRARRAGATR